tara:strand:- start:48 stop:698 length:651 start_codon:yes stop_codon:yes gene_type:complete
MAFFQIKDEDEFNHIGVGIYWQFNDDPNDCKVETYEHSGEKRTKYKLSLKYIGTSSVDGRVKSYKGRDGDWFHLREGESYEFTATEYLYGLLAKYNKNDGVCITTNKNGVKRDYVIKPLKGVSNDEGGNNENEKDTDVIEKVVYNNDRDMQIKWGMCLKEATNLSIATCADEKEPNYLQTIEHFTFKLMDIAVDGFKQWENEYRQKDQNSDIDELF